MSNYFASINRNKRSTCLNLKHQQGREAFLRLAKDADVVVENMRPGVTEKLGVDYETLKKINPRIIYASISGYGPAGPMAKRAGYDMIAGAEAGLLHLTGERNGPPVRPGLGVTDMCTELFTHGAIMAALLARAKTGRGQKIDASLFESQVALLTNVASTWLNMGQQAERWGTQHPSVVPYDAFKSKDLTNASRVEHRDELFPLLNDAFSKKTTDEWTVLFEGSGMPYAPINTMEKVFSHPQTHARDMVHQIKMDATKSGTLSILGPAVKLSETQFAVRHQPPLLGQHSKEILREIGYSEQKIAELAEKTVI